MPLVLKTQTKKKLKKVYLDKCSSGLLLPKSILNASSIKIFYVFIYFLSIGFSTQMSAQESIITGLENMNLSEGATIIIKNKENTIAIVTSNSNDIYKAKIVKNNNADHKKTVKEKLLFYNNIKPKKIIDEKTLKKIEEKINSKIVFNHNSKSEKNFSFSSYFYKIANNSNNNTVDKFTNIEIGLSISYLFVYQNRQNVLYEFYNSTNSKSYLFTRPPPSFY